MIKKLLFAVSVSAALVLPAVSQAAPIIYELDRTIGDGFVRGTIETDGTIGIIKSVTVVDPNSGASSAVTDQILDWNLVFSDGITEATVSKGVRGSNWAIRGDSFVATTTELTFDFDNQANPSDFVLLREETSGTNAWCLSTTNRFCGVLGANEAVITTGSATAQSAVIGGVMTINRVPEPAMVALLAVGLVSIGAARRRKA